MENNCFASGGLGSLCDGRCARLPIALGGEEWG